MEEDSSARASGINNINNYNNNFSSLITRLRDSWSERPRFALRVGVIPLAAAAGGDIFQQQPNSHKLRAGPRSPLARSDERTHTPTHKDTHTHSKSPMPHAANYAVCGENFTCSPRIACRGARAVVLGSSPRVQHGVMNLFWNLAMTRVLSIACLPECLG